MDTDSVAILILLGFAAQFLFGCVIYLWGFNKGWRARDEIWRVTHKTIQRLKEKEIQ